MADKILEGLYLVLASACLTALLLSPVACVMHQNQLIAEAIKNGTDPMAAHCAINTSTTHVCVERIKAK